MINNQKPLLITATLLNSWKYLFNNQAGEESQETLYNDFLKVLKREPTETTPAMALGNEFEKECYEGKVEGISEIIKGGAFQVVGITNVNLCGYLFVLYGRIDVLKNGVIYDIKRVSKYSDVQKYYTSVQHVMYLKLIPQAKEFKYLISDGECVYTETYDRNDIIEPIETTIINFVNWLKRNDLFDLYVEKWGN